VCILGHIQRGGAPTTRDRKLASVMGAVAVRELMNKKTCFMTGVLGHEPSLVTLGDAIRKKKKLPTDLLLLTKVLAT